MTTVQKLTTNDASQTTQLKTRARHTSVAQRSILPKRSEVRDASIHHHIFL
jgi:hypothetical protein